MTIVLTPLEKIPLIQAGDNLGEIIWRSLQMTEVNLEGGDILVVAQKIISKSEGRMVNLSTVTPSKRAYQLAKETEKDARLIELVLMESGDVLRTRPGTIIVEHKLGFVCANAGIDRSNILQDPECEDESVLLLPVNPDESAEKLRRSLETYSGVRVGVLVIDSHGRAWRMGVVGTTIGLSGLPGLEDLRGQADLFGETLKITQVACADELAAGASLLMGQAGEGTPVVHVRGFPYRLREAAFDELVRPRDMDLFR
jgi:coenzyme F420-0:L-glutamate ligase/coenzyme F420-1:gamma-L-glutamate ligase